MSKYSDIRLNKHAPPSKIEGLQDGYLNISSLIKHIDELRIFMQDENFDILSINETKLDNNIRNEEVEIKGYDRIRKDRNRNGGVVAIYVRNVIPYTMRNNLFVNDVEAICLEVKKPKRN